MDLKHLKPLLNNELWDLYTEVVKDKLKVKQDELNNAQESIQIYRLQGEIRTLKGILTLRDTVNAG